MHEIHLAGKVIWRKKYFRVYSKRDRMCEKMVYISPAYFDKSKFQNL